MRDGLLYITSQEIRETCAAIDPVEVVRRALADHASGATTLPDESYLSWSPGGGAASGNGSSGNGNGSSGDAPPTARSLGMPGMLGRSRPVVGTKVINANPANPKLGIPRASGLTVLFDYETARPVCVMEAAHISALRTASVTALAVDLLCSGPLTTVAVIGAGAQADAHLGLILSRLPDLERIALFDTNPDRAGALLRRHQEPARERGVSLETATSARSAILDTELVVTVTTVTSGYIPFEWLRPGATLVSVSLDDPLPDVVAKADIVVVDDWPLIRSDTRRLLGRLYREGLVCGPEEEPGEGCRRVDTTIGDLALGKGRGRRSADEIALVNPFGLAIEDLALAQVVYEKAISEGQGQLLPFEG
jgi:ornithine cyclodeaminase